ncbi:MAG: VWA domain-containing protein, partial [Deltaproteobacteria bacterium]|nr:VWA domain-containing protein [Deltaproteobacteria bacterium]
MGHGEYDLQAHQAATLARAALPSAQVFESNGCHPEMRPFGVTVRESRDSEAHPDSVGVVFALDVSGSMGEIPQGLATETMPLFMESVLTVLPDPQVLFIAFGNAWADRSPLQVGQFESEAALIDRWLSATHLEGGG